MRTAAELQAAADGGNKRATPVTRVRPGHADLAGALTLARHAVSDDPVAQATAFSFIALGT